MRLLLLDTNKELVDELHLPEGSSRDSAMNAVRGFISDNSFKYELVTLSLRVDGARYFEASLKKAKKKSGKKHLEVSDDE